MTSLSSVWIESGPIEGDLLWMQHKHVSDSIWNSDERRNLLIRRAVPTHMGCEAIPKEIEELLHQAGFYWACKLSYIKIDGGLIHALVERWRPETHTFHMRCGECTITLQDVAILLGLPVDGYALIGPTIFDWPDFCYTYLGVRPNDDDLDGSKVKLSWLAHHFGDVRQHMGNPEQLQRFTRAWILRFIGGALFVDKGSSKVSLRYLQFLGNLKECKNYSWGSAVLGFLYRQLCLATNIRTSSMGGMVLLLQLWAWERFTCLSPQITPSVQHHKPLGYRWVGEVNNVTHNVDVVHIRRKLDFLKRREVIWQPYTHEIVSSLPPICMNGTQVWRCVVPLLCFQIAEWHQPDRVMRQFGLSQHIPQPPSQPENLHALTLKGKLDKDWIEEMGPVIRVWQSRDQYCVDGFPAVEDLSYNDDYMVWYRKKTKMFIDPRNARLAEVTNIGETLIYMSSDQGWDSWDQDDLEAIGHKLILIGDEIERITEAATAAPKVKEAFQVDDTSNICRRSRETRGVARNRQVVQPEPIVLPPIPKRQHGMYYTPTQFTQDPYYMPDKYTYPDPPAHQEQSTSSPPTAYQHMSGSQK